MNYIQLAIALILFNLCFGVIAATGIFTAEAEDLVTGKLSENRIIEVLSGSASVSFNPLDWGSYILDGISMFLIPLQAAFYIPRSLGSSPFHLPDAIVNLVWLACVSVYAVGLAEFLRGFSGGGT